MLIKPFFLQENWKNSKFNKQDIGQYYKKALAHPKWYRRYILINVIVVCLDYNPKVVLNRILEFKKKMTKDSQQPAELLNIF